jgi:predicted GTPase
MTENVIIMGAAGRDFHNFNIYFKNNPRYKVIGFTAAQIPDIEGRIYPPELSGKLYPQGVPIYSENRLTDLIREHKVDLVAFSYSDIPHTEVMHKASVAMAGGADFILIGATYTMLKSNKTVVAVCAVRTGCGKSQTTRHICQIMKNKGKKVVAIRHPMPYGDLTRQTVQRFATYEDIKKHQCTIEEREEYEPLVSQGVVVYSGIDYERILKAAEEEADVIVWDGGNNDTPFYYPDVHIVIFDPHRAGHELLYYPGETNMLMADIAVINKVDSAAPQQIEAVRKNIIAHAPNAKIVLAESAILIDDPEKIKGQRVLVVEDGPTLTHGGMSYGAGVIAAKMYAAAHIVDPKTHAVGTIKNTYSRYPNIGSVLPAMGYSKKQIHDLELTINQAECDLVLCATPIDLPKLLSTNKPNVRVRYEYKDHSNPVLEDVLLECLKKTEMVSW